MRYVGKVPVAAVQPAHPGAIGQVPCGGSVQDVHHWVQTLEGLAARPEEALALDVSLPFCVWQCLYCDRDIEAGLDPDSMARHVDALIREMSLVADTLGRRHDVLKLHFGGGSPNHLDCAQIERLVQALHERFRIPAEAEWSIGCDPRRCSATQMERLHRLGFRQLRFGQADLDPTVQAAAGRLQSAALLADVMQMAREARFRCLQLELVCGLPGQTEERWQATLQAMLDLAPDRIRCLPFRRPPAWMDIGAPARPDPAQCARLWRAAADGLVEAGYRWIGSDLFVLEDDPLAHAQEQGELSWLDPDVAVQPLRQQLAFGPGRVSRVDGVAARNFGPRDLWQQALAAHRWPLAEVHVADADERRRRLGSESLRCRGVLPTEALDAGLRADLVREAGDALIPGVQGLHLTPEGRYRLDALCALIEGPARGCGSA